MSSLLFGQKRHTNLLALALEAIFHQPYMMRLGDEMANHSSILAGKFHGQQTLSGCSPCNHKSCPGIHMTRRVYYTFEKSFSLTYIRLKQNFNTSKSLVELMTNLDSILKSRDITLPTKVCLVKATVFPVVMHGCESWTVKKVEH